MAEYLWKGASALEKISAAQELTPSERDDWPHRVEQQEQKRPWLGRVITGKKMRRAPVAVPIPESEYRALLKKAAFFDELEKLSAARVHGQADLRKKYTGGDTMGEWAAVERGRMKKTAGVGVDIYGYGAGASRGDCPKDPDSVEALEWYEKRDASRLKTPFDKETNYKVNLLVLQNFQRTGDKKDVFQGWHAQGKPSPFMDEKATDIAYSSKGKIVNLGRRDIRSLIKDYKAREIKGQGLGKAQAAFLGKANALLRDKRLKFARVEYE